MKILFGLLTFFAFAIGAAWGELPGALGLSGLMVALGMITTLRRQVQEQGRRLELHDVELKRLRTSLKPLPEELVSSPALDNDEAGEPEAASPSQLPREAAQVEARDTARKFAQEAFERPVPKQLPTPPAPPAHFEKAGAVVREFLTGGNTVVRVGALVLMVGVVLLLKYAAEHSVFPIELRMASAALIGVALVAVGFRHRESRRGFSMTLQGAGVATTYLVVFFSLRMYELLPVPLAFGLLAGLAVFSGAMAVLQNSLSLIVIGIVGGFLAPVLASTGTGDHVALFSYYTLLNLLIVAVAWFKSWRPLNLLGFFFTFGIGTIWGSLAYTPEHFRSTEPFLVGFFLLYVAIVAIFAWRRPAELKGWVDGSLTFGTPLAFLALQYQMVERMPFGMAFTAAGMAAVYIVAASVLFRRAPKAMRNLVEAFLALGIGFATLAVPYGFSNQSLTGATWAIEGFALFWLGIRQSRALSRWAGMALQFLAGAALLASLLARGYPADALPVLNTPFAGAVFLTLAGMGVAYLSYFHRAKLGRVERASIVFIPWAVLWWSTIAVREVFEHVPFDYVRAALVVLAAVSVLAFELAGRKLEWHNGRLPALLAVPCVLLSILLYQVVSVALNSSVNGPGAMSFSVLVLRDNPLAFGGWIAWPLLFGAMYFALFRYSRDYIARMRVLHIAALWSVGLFAAFTLAYFVRGVDGLGASWSVAASGCGWMIVLVIAAKLRSRIASEPMRAYYKEVVSAGLVLTISIWFVRTAVLSSGDGSPLPYLPLLNPLDITLGLAFLSCLVWVRGYSKTLYPALGGMAFLWFNGILARSVHHFDSVPYFTDALWRSVPFQVSLSVSWALIGLATILWATRAANRYVWFAGGGLLAVVVCKLFLVDLKNLSSVAKIATFLVVGLLLLVVGYFSPMPPSPSSSETTARPDTDPS